MGSRNLKGASYRGDLPSKSTERSFPRLRRAPFDSPIRAALPPSARDRYYLILTVIFFDTTGGLKG
jgi:hypothetical protein